MSNRAAEILLALNNQIKHSPPQKATPFDNLNQELAPSPDKKKVKENLQP
jgi:hypothetical protein